MGKKKKKVEVAEAIETTEAVVEEVKVEEVKAPKKSSTVKVKVTAHNTLYKGKHLKRGDVVEIDKDLLDAYSKLVTVL